MAILKFEFYNCNKWFLTIGQRSDLSQLDIGQWHLLKNIIFYIYYRKTNGTAMLQVADHDSMSGEHVGSIAGLIYTSGKLVIWLFAAPENQGFRKLWKFPRKGKDLGKLQISICEEAGCS